MVKKFFEFRPVLTTNILGGGELVLEGISQGFPPPPNELLGWSRRVLKERERRGGVYECDYEARDRRGKK